MEKSDLLEDITVHWVEWKYASTMHGELSVMLDLEPMKQELSVVSLPLMIKVLQQIVYIS